MGLSRQQSDNLEEYSALIRVYRTRISQVDQYLDNPEYHATQVQLLEEHISKLTTQLEELKRLVTDGEEIKAECRAHIERLTVQRRTILASEKVEKLKKLMQELKNHATS